MKNRHHFQTGTDVWDVPWEQGILLRLKYLGMCSSSFFSADATSRTVSSSCVRKADLWRGITFLEPVSLTGRGPSLYMWVLQCADATTSAQSPPLSHHPLWKAAGDLLLPLPGSWIGTLKSTVLGWCQVFIWTSCFLWAVQIQNNRRWVKSSLRFLRSFFL